MTGTTARCVDVALPVPIDHAFTYLVPDGVACPVGVRVAVNFHGQKTTGVVVRVDTVPPPGVALRSIARVLDDEPAFDPELLSFLTEAARYYMAPLGEVLRLASPAVETSTVRALRGAGFLEPGQALGARTVAVAETVLLRRSDVPRPDRLGPRMAALLDSLPADGSAVPRDAIAEAAHRDSLRRLVALGLVVVDRQRALDPFFDHSVERDVPKAPTAEQAVAMDTLDQAVAAGESAAFLLHGVTGSGKTEVYLAAIAATLARGRSALLLVPEIGLTPQLVGRLRARFGEDIAVLHSALPPRKRHEAWEGLRSGRIRIAVGARSALLAPLHDLGLVVVDEEHDPSYKQEEGFRYHARDMALLRAARASAVCVLGSATPSLEAFELAERGRLSKLVLTRRATGAALPTVEVVDLRRHRNGPLGPRYLSGPLVRGLEACLARREQAILFLNRRGFAPTLRCEACGGVERCPACDLPLTEHRARALMRCHTCDFARPIPERCSTCGSEDLSRAGAGTEAVVDVLAKAFPTARIGRFDRDSVEEEGSFAALDAMRSRELDVLVGTQMVTKGHDLPGVSFVGVLLADQGLAFPDFRAAERTFQLVAQVAGRAGRADAPGKVVIQTYAPEVPAIVHATRHDYEAFFHAERAERAAHGMPPVGRLAAVRIDAGDESVALRVAAHLADLAKRHAAVRDGHVTVLGPAAAPIARARGRCRQRFLLRAADRRVLRAVLDVVRRAIDAGVEPARASVDVDPVSMM